MPQRDGPTLAGLIGRLVSHALAGLAVGGLAGLLSCGDSSGPGELTPGPLANVVIIGGDDQQAVVGTELPQPLRVRAVDADDRPIPGQIVNFRVVSGGGSVFAGAALTNEDGVAQERWTLGTNTSEEQRLEVRAVDSDTGDPIVFGVFRATALPAGPHAMVLVTAPSDPAQSRVSFPIQPAVRLNDAHGNPVGAGVVVTAAISDGGGTLGGTATATTASNGVATFSNLSIAGVIGPRILSFSAPAVTGVSAFIRLVAGLPALVAHDDGNNQSAVVGSAVPGRLAVRVTDDDGNVVGAGVPVTFAVATGGGSVTGANATTNSEGIASVGSWTLGENPGTNTLTATSPAPVHTAFTFSATALAAFKAQSISVGNVHACARSLENVAYCWGSNVLPGNSTGGSLGIGESGGFRVVPTQVIGGQTFQSLLAGAGHTCGLTSGAAAYCWGWNLHYGQVGDGSSENRYAPVAVAGSLTFDNLAPGGIHTCGINATGAAYCWGGNLWGQLGDGSKVNRRTPVLVLGGLVFQALTAGGQHTCGLVDGGPAYCWGRNNVGQLGNDRLEDRSDPDAIGGGLAFERLTAGEQHTCGLTSTGAGYCWGYAYFGQLGDGTSGSTPEGYATLRRSPVPVSGGLRFSDLSAGTRHTCGVEVSGTLYCWGRIANHELGAVPAPIAPQIAFKKIAAGGNLTCGIATDDTVYCWDGSVSPPARVQAP